MHAIVLVVNKLPFAQLGVYGNEWVNTPSLDRLAYDGFVFDQCYATNPVDGQWLLATATGYPPFPWLMEEEQQRQVLEQGPLATLSRQGSVATCRLGRSPSLADVTFSETLVLPEMGLEALLQKGISWLEQHEGRPALLWIDLAELEFDGQLPADIPSEELTQYLEEHEPAWPATGTSDVLSDEELDVHRTTVAGAVSWLDRCLGEFFDAASELPDETLLVVTADSGLPLGEHGTLGTVAEGELLEERTHVPLILGMTNQEEESSANEAAEEPADKPIPNGFSPQKIRPGARSPALVQATDLPATLSAWFAVETDIVDGKSLLGLVAGEPVKLRDYTCSGADDAVYSLRSHHWKLVLPVSPPETEEAEIIPSDSGTAPLEEDLDDSQSMARLLFSKPEDRWEMHDLADQKPGVCDSLELQLRRYLDALMRGTLTYLVPLRVDGEE